MNDTARIIPIPPHLIGEMWPHVAPHLMKGLAKATDLTLRQVVDDLVNGTDQLWCVIDRERVLAAFLTAIYIDEDRNERFLGLYGLGGTDFKLWGHMLDARISQAALAAGCARIRFAGREAWSRVFPQYAITGHRGDEAIYERAVQ